MPPEAAMGRAVVLMKAETAFVLGAGLGTRLRPLTERLPKPLLAVAGRPLIAAIFDSLVSVGVRRIIVNTHHLAERYGDFFAERKWGGAELVFVYEPVLLDTAGGLKNIERHWQDTGPLLLHNGDVFSTLDVRRVLERHAELRAAHGVVCTLAVRSREEPRHVRWRPGEGLVKGIHAGGAPGPGECDVLYAGVCVVEREFVGLIPAGIAIGLVAVWKEALRAGQRIGAVLCDEGEWTDIGTLEAYEELNRRLAESRVC
jgi:mannose-1-phosphate guanylyltransferase